VLGLPGDLDPLIAGVFPEPADPTRLSRSLLGIVGDAASAGRAAPSPDRPMPKAVRSDLHALSAATGTTLPDHDRPVLKHGPRSPTCVQVHW